MIVARVSAENVLKYAHLELARLPVRGLIGISGPNESGKSTIAETLCFALFGRTFVFPANDLAQIIRWGQTRCRVSIDLLADGRTYQVLRHLDDSGLQAARLNVVGHAEPLARGVEAVDKRLGELLGFGFPEFVESIYFAQRDAMKTRLESPAINSIAGVAPLERIGAELDDELRYRNQVVADIQHDLSDIQQQISDLSVTEETVPALQAERSALRDEQEDQLRRRAMLEERTRVYDNLDNVLENAAQGWLNADTQTSYHQWRHYVAQLEEPLGNIERAVEGLPGADSLSPLKGLVDDMKRRLDVFAALNEQAKAYASRRQSRAETGDEQATNEVPAATNEDRRWRQQLDVLGRRRRMSRIVAVLSLVVAAVAWGLWVLFEQAPEGAIADTIAAWTAGYGVDMGQSSELWLVPIAGALTVLFVVFVARSIRLNAELSKLERVGQNRSQQLIAERQQGQALAGLSSMPLAEAITRLERIDDEDVQSATHRFLAGGGAELVEAEQLSDHQHTLRERLSACSDGCEKARQHLSAQVEEMRAEIEIKGDRVAEIERVIAQQQNRLKKHDDLKGLTHELQMKLKDRQRDLAVRNLARDLVAGACHDISREFRRAIATSAGTLLPMLTEGRYEHLQIDEQHGIRVFSPEKHDFMSMYELSSGMQRQIMLAVRLALARKLINGSARQGQFILLDEPFAHFDPVRVHAALELMPKFGDQVTQVWLIGPEFSDDAALALHVPCTRDSDVLTVESAENNQA
jgi:DNA repair exonuclease SbcCD ATPase subunit